MAVSKLQGVRHMAAAVVVGLMLLIALIVTKTQSGNDSGGMGVSALEQVERASYMFCDIQTHEAHDFCSSWAEDADLFGSQTSSYLAKSWIQQAAL